MTVADGNFLVKPRLFSHTVQEVKMGRHGLNNSNWVGESHGRK